MQTVRTYRHPEGTVVTVHQDEKHRDDLDFCPNCQAVLDTTSDLPGPPLIYTFDDEGPYCSATCAGEVLEGFGFHRL